MPAQIWLSLVCVAIKKRDELTMDGYQLSPLRAFFDAIFPLMFDVV